MNKSATSNSNVSVIDQITSEFYHHDELSQIVLPTNTNVVCNSSTSNNIQSSNNDIRNACNTTQGVNIKCNSSKSSFFCTMNQVQTNLHVVIALNISESHTFLVNYVPLTLILTVLILLMLIMITQVGFVIIASQEFVMMNFPSRMVPLLILNVR